VLEIWAMADNNGWGGGGLLCTVLCPYGQFLKLQSKFQERHANGGAAVQVNEWLCRVASFVSQLQLSQR
jgi:hypothetical protein